MTAGAAERRPGERGFTVLLFLFSCFALYESLLLRREHPGPSSCAVLPLGASLTLAILSLWNILQDGKRRAPSTGGGHAVREGLSYAVPREVAVLVGFIVLYCAALRIGLGFFVATPPFLWGSMTYLGRGSRLGNLAWTALALLFVWLVFALLFNVVLP